MAKENFSIKSLGVCRIDAPQGQAFFIADDSSILIDASMAGCKKCKGVPDALEQAGPRQKIFFEPSAVRAGIVTCGGLCPGLNDVIRALTMVIWYRYGVRKITGFKYGYEGLCTSPSHPPIDLTPDLVADIHKHGGTILGTSRGHHDPAKMVDFLHEHKINILFTIGGDGTQRGAMKIAEEVERRGLQIAVVGIPKTIDNDISFTERTFGFETAVAMSEIPITCVHMEAKGVRNGIGLVKLMGRESGFVAAYAALASSDVNLVLVPEVPFLMKNLFSFLEDRMKRKSHAVIVVAEGAGQEFVPVEGTDASGNKKLGDIGIFLKKTIADHFAKIQNPVNVRYIDPSYIIRSAPANADDSVFCFRLSENAVHAATAGKTAMVVGLWNGHFVHVPMKKATHTRKKINPTESLWQSVLHNTGQPDLCGNY
ncbi:MAG: ATP-dependent 6-phosphofructokinase [Kiritimatiellae bacterium]|nr:ATP-dependent 6-phosphofructokinase [Kiritimatiellia bacterium]